MRKKTKTLRNDISFDVQKQYKKQKHEKDDENETRRWLSRLKLNLPENIRKKSNVIAFR